MIKVCCRESHEADSAIGIERKRTPGVGNVLVEREVLHRNGRETHCVECDEPSACRADLGRAQLQHCRGRAVAQPYLLALREQGAALRRIERAAARDGERQQVNTPHGGRAATVVQEELLACRIHHACDDWSRGCRQCCARKLGQRCRVERNNAHWCIARGIVEHAT